MSPLAKKRLEVELKQVEAARGAQELRKEELLEQITSLDNNIAIQIKREDELKQQLKEMV